MTDYIAGEATTNMDSDEVAEIRDLTDPDITLCFPGPPFCGEIDNPLADPGGRAAAYKAWYDQVAAGHPWDHKGAISNAYGLSTPVPGREGEISWDIWSNIHYGIVGRHAGFSAFELEKGADAADLASQHHTDEGDQLAVRIGIELYEKYGENVTADQIRQAVIDHYDEFAAKGKVSNDGPAAGGGGGSSW